MKTNNSKRTTLLIIVIGAVGVVAAVDIWMRMRAPNENSVVLDAIAADEPATRPGPAEKVKMEVAAQKNIGLKLAAADFRNVVETLQVTGSVGPNETRVAHVRPLTQGRILDVLAIQGDTVRTGQTLTVYDNIELGELLGQYNVGLAALEKARANAEAARKSAERAQNLVALGAVAQAELERRNAEVAGNTAAINTELAELARIEEKMHRYGLSDDDIKEALRRDSEHREVSRTTVRAPFGGVITNADLADGEVVGSDREIFTIADLSTVWVQADVYEKDIALLRKDLTVRVTVDAFPGETFPGRVTYISDILDPKTRTTKVRCEVPNSTGRLKVDMFATISIATPQGRTAVMVPSAAIQSINDQPVIFVAVSETEFERRDIVTGITEGEWTEIRSGVKQKEQVVTMGSFDLKSLLLREQIGEDE